ncbi:DUF5700 domain-containing putative Zn-dependent protease [Candidatus Zixiibacteriota bacterium]
MNRIQVVVIAGLIALLTQGCCSTCRTENVVTIDFKAAELTIDWLDLAASGASEVTLQNHFFNTIAPTLGCQAIIQHWARFREWDQEIFYDFILESAGIKPTDQTLTDEDGVLTSFGKRRELWSSALADPDRLRENLQALKEADPRKAALRVARRYLPRDADITNEFYIVLFGASNAFSLGDVNGYDLLQMPLTSDGDLNIPDILRTFAHELHHTGFTSAANLGMREIEDDSRILLAGLLASEGMATWLISRPLDHIDEYRTALDENTRGVARDWDRLLPQLPELYLRAESDIRLNLSGELGQSELLAYWLEGYQGPVYALGSDMIATIERHLGLRTLRTIPDDYRLFLRIYNQAAQKALARGEAVFLFDEALADQLADYRN